MADSGRQGAITVGGVEIQPGQRVTVDLDIARLYTRTALSLPVHVIHGRAPGPRVFVCAAIHGDEINGTEIIRRLLRSRSLGKLRGTLIAVPVVNVYGFVQQSRYSPDRRDLNRFFPGSDSGSMTSRLAHQFMENVVRGCEYGIDLHTGSNHRSNLPQIRAYLDDEETRRLAVAFGAPVVLDADLLEGSLRQAAHDEGVRILLYEAGETLRFDERAIRTGLQGVYAVLRAIGMLSEASKGSGRPVVARPAISRASTWVRAPLSGILITRAKLGDSVAEGDRIGEIVDPFENWEEPVFAKTDGIVIGRTHLPLVHKGDALFHLAQVENPERAEAALDTFRQEFEPDAGV